MAIPGIYGPDWCLKSLFIVFIETDDSMPFFPDRLKVYWGKGPHFISFYILCTKSSICHKVDDQKVNVECISVKQYL